MKKLIFAALIMLFASCERVEFEYFFDIEITHLPYCGSVIEFEPYTAYSNTRKDISKEAANDFFEANNYEHIVTVQINGKETKAIKKSVCKIFMTRKH